jgi:hypothetical protein
MAAKKKDCDGQGLPKKTPKDPCGAELPRHTDQTVGGRLGPNWNSDLIFSFSSLFIHLRSDMHATLVLVLGRSRLIILRHPSDTDAILYYLK